MSRKKNEVLSTVLTTTEEFQEFIDQPGSLSVIDCHPKWCGPCKSITTYFKRLKMEAGDARLKFGVACIEDCDQLQTYVDSVPEPLFLFFASGFLVARIRGCSGPLLTVTTLDMLKKETLIANGEADRVEISLVEKSTPAKDSLGARDSYQSIRSSQSATAQQEQAKQVTFSIITPNYLDRVEEVLEELSSSGVEVLEMRQVQLSEDDVRAIKPDLESSSGWEEWMTYMTSNTCTCLILTRVGDLGVGIVSQMNLLTGPLDQSVAEKEAPDSINSLYGSMAMYTTPNVEQALQAINTVFPNFTPPSAVQSNTKELMANKYVISGSTFSEDVEGQLGNYGVSILERQDDGNVLVSCSRSINNFRDILGGIDGELEVSAAE